MNFTFRDKRTGWGHRAGVTYRDKRGKLRYRLLPAKASSYFGLFLQGQTCRDSCYRCPYACLSRVADLTLGDYWGIEKEHPEYLSDHGGTLRKESGISCVLVNTAIGEAMLSRFGEGLELLPSEPERVARQNSQLRQPSAEGKNREEVLRIYRQQGYDGIEKWFRKWLGPKRYVFNLWYKLPKGLRKLIR
jgi:coenzyme F420-reducing hydrogenase beta subunit